MQTFSKSWIRKPILDIYKCPKVKSWLKIGTKTSLFSLSQHNGNNFIKTQNTVRP